MLKITMKLSTRLIFLYVFMSCDALSTRGQRAFPQDFIFGASSAAFQVEGAWNESGKTESIWDKFTHETPRAIRDHSNADIAADSYHNYRRDVEMMREIGLDAYRISISWSRLLPSGFTNEVNQAGLDFYNNYINEMIKYNIRPIITMYHWDLPQKIQNYGGFLNPMFVQWFEDYARLLYQLFGDRVKHWITFNDPKEICFSGYSTNSKPPAVNSTDIGEFLCARNLLLAHAKAYHIYNDDFKPIRGGECGIAFKIFWLEGDTDSEDDSIATELMRQADWILYTDPIFSKDGGFPKELSNVIDHNSAKQGYRRSRMPKFTEEEKAFIRGTADFFGLSYYTGAHVSASKFLDSNHWIYEEFSYGFYQPDDWTRASPWIALAPNCLYKSLVEIMEKYNNPKIYITENGWPTSKGLNDHSRVRYYREIWEDCLDALKLGVNLKGYFARSLFDGFEWNSGYTERYGLYEVDFTSPARTRTPRKSAFEYKQIIKSRRVDHDYEPRPLNY